MWISLGGGRLATQVTSGKVKDITADVKVTDGEAHPGCISKVHLRDGQQLFEVLCRHDSYEPEEDQRSHPHPSFTPDGRRVVFTANHGGQSNIYLVDWENPAE